MSACSHIGQCLELPSIANGFITYDVEFGQEATYQCFPGYFLVGVRVRNCTVIDNKGIWIAQPPNCCCKFSLSVCTFVCVCVCVCVNACMCVDALEYVFVHICSFIYATYACIYACVEVDECLEQVVK